MLNLATFLTVSFAVYACIKWWFDTDIVSYFLRGVTFRKFKSLVDVKEALAQRGRVGCLLVELFECPWCLSFHFSFWLNIIAVCQSDTFDISMFALHVLGTAGCGMYLWMKDLKD